MTDTKSCTCDALIMGGGVAGLWTACILENAGYSVIVLDANPLGTGQSIISQGIIHAGVKYALTEKNSDVDFPVSDMPEIWACCLQGKGDVDLTAVEILSDFQYIWPAPGFASSLATMVASKLLRSSSSKLSSEQFPEILKRSKSSAVYTVNELVLDPRSLLTTLKSNLSNPVKSISSPTQLKVESKGCFRIITNEEDFKITTSFVVLSAGQGNGDLLSLLSHSYPDINARQNLMQLRPLHQVFVRRKEGENLPKFYGHCIGTSSTPEITISSHVDDAGRLVWWLGGSLAEKGVSLSSEEQIKVAKEVMKKCVPSEAWNSDEFEWGTLECNRAEGKTSGGLRPNGPSVLNYDGLVVTWPTKLTLAPAVAYRIADIMKEQNIVGRGSQTLNELRAIQSSNVAEPPWNRSSHAG